MIVYGDTCFVIKSDRIHALRRASFARKTTPLWAAHPTVMAASFFLRSVCLGDGVHLVAENRNKVFTKTSPVKSRMVHENAFLISCYII